VLLAKFVRHAKTRGSSADFFAGSLRLTTKKPRKRTR